MSTHREIEFSLHSSNSSYHAATGAQSLYSTAAAPGTLRKDNRRTRQTLRTCQGGADENREAVWSRMSRVTSNLQSNLECDFGISDNGSNDMPF